MIGGLDALKKGRVPQHRSLKELMANGPPHKESSGHRMIGKVRRELLGQVRGQVGKDQAGTFLFVAFGDRIE